MTNFLAHRWGDVASVAGLIVSIWVLVVARKARQAAEDARSAARLKSLVEVFSEATSKAQQIGIFMIAGRWELVRLRAEEILDTCKLIGSRWAESLPQGAAHDLDDAVTITRSIAGAAADASMRELSRPEQRQVADAQLELSGLLAGILGAAREAEEKGE